jgi:hypothetical protein
MKKDEILWNRQEAIIKYWNTFINYRLSLCF